MANETRDAQVVTVRLSKPADFFSLADTDQISEFRNYLTGIEMAISDLRGSFSRKPVHLIVELPEETIEEGLTEKMRRALINYCQHRIRYNTHELAATRHDGIASLWIGLLITAFGLVAAYVFTHIDVPEGLTFVGDHTGWVFAWVGLWYPLDTIIFTPRPYRREKRELERLMAADVEVRPWT